ncbi:MAG: alpha-galactosidase, partial [Lachnospiraceae bacterium]|nr:alpha-galactosidase [Lachnospiraceae bacterium]
MREKVSHGKGTTVNYEKDSVTVTEDMLLEVSGLGKGDFREPFVIVKYGDGSITSDFIYESASIPEAPLLMEAMPCAIPDGDGSFEQLEIVLKERVKNVRLKLIYTVFPKCDVITRRAVLVNESDETIVINRLMSTQLDIDECGLKAITFSGNWGREMARNDTIVSAQTLVNSTTTGVSSNRSNPFMMLTESDATEEAGDCYGFNLVYSGNHMEIVNVGGFYKTRFLSGINPVGFEWNLKAGESFETPEAVMTFSPAGYRGLSLNMQHFVKRHIVRGNFKDKERPILLNSWEAAYFNISESRILSLARKAKEAGIELLVMDDGWFKGRNDDTSSLGDWTEDKKKLPGGIESIAAKVHEVGLDFGVWIEPEMISENSDLFREHPEYAMRIPGRDNSPGRNQMILDLTNSEVRDYVKTSMKRIIGKKGVNYIKWDMNRMFSDVYSGVLDSSHQQETAHRYVLGLYEIVKYLTEEFPDVLFENCASGGNRFDPGILSYFPQIWASDDSDAIARVQIQEGYSYGYPQSTYTAH